MANYYKQTSFIVPCTIEQADIGLRAANLIRDTIYNEADIPDDLTDPTAQIARQWIVQHTEEDFLDFSVEIAQNEEDYLGFSTDEQEPEGLWFYGEESFNIEQAAAFIQLLQKTFALPPVVIQGADTCSKHNSDGFGGWCAMVTSEQISYGSTYALMEDAHKFYQPGQATYCVACAGTDGNTNIHGIIAPVDWSMDKVLQAWNAQTVQPQTILQCKPLNAIQWGNLCASVPHLPKCKLQ